MKYTVIFRAEARDEAIEAAAYVADHASPDMAMHWYQRLEEAVDSLAYMPARCGHARENGMIPGVELRQLICMSHRLIFTIRGNEVHVLHVRHAARATLNATESEEI